MEVAGYNHDVCRREEREGGRNRLFVHEKDIFWNKTKQILLEGYSEKIIILQIIYFPLELLNISLFTTRQLIHVTTKGILNYTYRCTHALLALQVYLSPLSSCMYIFDIWYIGIIYYSYIILHILCHIIHVTGVMVD